MKKSILSCVFIFVLSIALLSQNPYLQVQQAAYQPQNNWPTIQNSNASILSVSASDTLRYFFNKHYFRNPSSGSPAPNNQFYTLSNPYPSSTFTIDYCGGIFLSATTITVTGLEGIVTRRANASSVNVPFKLYLCNVSGANLPIFPPLDSVSAMASASTNGAWVGGNFTTAVTVNGKFAVLYKNVSTTVGDTLGLFINNACTPTSTCPAYQKYGESLGSFRINGNFQLTTNSFGSGTDYEFLVAPRIAFNYTSAISVLNPTICTNATATFSNVSSPFNLIENRQFNFNKFAAVWGALSNTILPTTDSIYNWTFTGSTTGALTSKHATAFFNTGGFQTASLAVKYNKSRAGGFLPSIADLSTATVNVSSSNAPTLAITGNSIICAGSSVTLTASGNTTYTWTNNAASLPTIIVTPSITTVYTVTGVNGACVGYQTFTVNVVTNPSVLVSGPSSACAGSTVVLTASGASTYTWSNSSTTNSTTVSTSVAGVQVLTVTGQVASCPASSTSKTVTIVALPGVTLTAAVTTVCTKATGGNTVQLTGTPSGGSYSGSGVGAGAFTPINPGTFVQNYLFTNTSTGCSNSATTSVLVATCQTGVGLNEAVSVASPVIFPNPTTNGFVELKNLIGFSTVKVYNSLGALIKEIPCSKQSITLDLSDSDSGLYIIKIIGSTETDRTFKLINRKE